MTETPDSTPEPKRAPKPRKAAPAVSTSVQSQGPSGAGELELEAELSDRPTHGKPVQFGGDPYGDTPMQSR